MRRHSPRAETRQARPGKAVRIKEPPLAPRHDMGNPQRGLQNRYGPGPAVSRADPIPEAVGGHRNGTCPPAAIRNCPEMTSSVTDCYWMPVAAAADPFSAPPLAQGWVGGCPGGLVMLRRLTRHPA